MMMVTLTCLAGHEWQRPVQRGRKPVWCEEHRPVIVPSVTDNETEVLTCTYGHKFTRIRTRGRKPSLCVDHKALEITTQNESPGTVSTMTEPYPTDLMDSLKATVLKAKGDSQPGVAGANSTSEAERVPETVMPVDTLKPALTGKARGAALVVTMSRLSNKKRSVIVHQYPESVVSVKRA